MAFCGSNDSGGWGPDDASYTAPAFLMGEGC